MEKVILCKEEIQHLFDFVRSKYVRYVDVQYEIVDHLASAIEDEMTADPDLTFKAALTKVYGKFPITGFAKWVEHKTTEVHRYWYKRLGVYMIGFMTIPRILITLMIFGIIYTGLIYMGSWAIWTFAIIGTGISFYTNYHYSKMFKGLDEGKFLFITSFRGVIGSIGMSGVYPALYMDKLDLNHIWIASHGKILAISVVLTLIYLLLIASLFHFPGEIRKEIDNKYHHLKIKLQS